MSWVKLDDLFADHPKIKAVGPFGLAIQVAAICYSARHLTDGHISYAAAKSLIRSVLSKWVDAEGRIWSPDMGCGMTGQPANGGEWEQALLQARLWDAAPGGYQIHDYGEFNPSRSDVLQARSDQSAKKQAAGRLGGLARVANVATKQSASKPQAEAQATVKQPSSRIQAPIPIPIPCSASYEAEAAGANAPAPPAAHVPDQAAGGLDSVGTCGVCGYHGPGPAHHCLGPSGTRAIGTVMPWPPSEARPVAGVIDGPGPVLFVGQERAEDNGVRMLVPIDAARLPLEAGGLTPEPPPKRKGRKPKAAPAVARYGVADETANQLAWRRWREVYAASKRYGAYTESPEDGPTMARLAKHAEKLTLTRPSRSGPELDAASLDLLLLHWFREYLRDPGGKNFPLSDRQHALRFLPNSIPAYGSPWAKGDRSKAWPLADAPVRSYAGELPAPRPPAEVVVDHVRRVPRAPAAARPDANGSAPVTIPGDVLGALKAIGRPPVAEATSRSAALDAFESFDDGDDAELHAAAVGAALAAEGS